LWLLGVLAKAWPLAAIMSAASSKAVTSASKGSSASQCWLKRVGRVRNLLFERGSLCCLVRHKHFLSRDVDTNGGLNDNASRMRVTEEGIVLMIFFLDYLWLRTLACLAVS
jgi:hypothetical protein